MIHLLRMLGCGGAVAGLVLVGCGSSGGDSETVAETTSQELSLGDLCGDICAGLGGAACFSVGGGVEGAIACGIAGNIGCSNACGKTLPYRPTKKAAEACLQNLGLGYPNCYATTRFQQLCTVHWGDTGDWGHAAVQWKAAGSGPPVIVSYKIDNGGPLHERGDFATDCRK